MQERFRVIKYCLSLYHVPSTFMTDESVTNVMLLRYDPFFCKGTDSLEAIKYSVLIVPNIETEHGFAHCVRIVTDVRTSVNLSLFVIVY